MEFVLQTDSFAFELLHYVLYERRLRHTLDFRRRISKSSGRPSPR